MAHANFIELETCLDQCIDYCTGRLDEDYVEYHYPRLRDARAKFHESIEVTDRVYLAWQKEQIEDKIAWKHLAKELKAAQKHLRQINAIGYPDRNILHWDTEALTFAVDEMAAWLRERADAIEEATARADKLERLLSSAQGEGKEEDEALDEYNRHALFLSAALGSVNSAIADFRVAMRRTLGKGHDDYQSIRWPMSVAPDEPVL